MYLVGLTLFSSNNILTTKVKKIRKKNTKEETNLKQFIDKCKILMF